MSRNIMLTIGFFLVSLSAHASPALDTLLSEYRKEGTQEFNLEKGKEFFYQERKDSETNEMRSCSTCHTQDLTKEGKQVNTGKILKPLAPSANSTRLTDLEEMRKWLKRNCKWTLGRECTAQEKGDVLTFINSQ